MEENHPELNGQDISRYSQDIKTIKELLLETKNYTIYERWAFYVWGGLLIVGGILHFTVEGFIQLKPMEYFFYIWVPILVLAGFLELVSFIRNLTKKALTLFSRPIIKFFLSLVLYTLIMVFVSNILLRHHYYTEIPVFIAFGIAGFLAMYSLATHINYLVPSYTLGTICIILYFTPLSTRVLTLLCGICGGLACISCGIICYYLEKRE